MIARTGANPTKLKLKLTKMDALKAAGINYQYTDTNPKPLSINSALPITR